MKRFLTMTMLAMLLCLRASAFYPAFDNRYGGVTYPHAVMDVKHDVRHIYVAKLDGLVVVEKATGRKTVYSSEQGTLAYTPTAIELDSRGILWVGTLEGTLLSLKAGKFTRYDYGMDDRLSNIAFDDFGKMYVTSGRYGYQVDTLKKKVERFDTYWWGYPGWTGHLRTDGDGTLWIANYGLQGGMAFYGLGAYTPDDGTTFLFKEDKTLDSGNVYAMALDRSDNVWYVNQEQQLVKLSGNEAEARYDLPFLGFDMEFDDSGTLWLAGANGPLLAMRGGKFTSHPCDMVSNRWLCLDIDGEAIYVGTDEALLKYEGGEWSTIDIAVSAQSAPSTPTGVTAVQASEGTQQWFDLQGRRVEGQPRHGVYIQDGRKHVVK